MTSKSPFEIRLDVLKMAQEILDAQQRSQEKYYEKQLELLKSCNANAETIVNFINSTSPTKAYTEQDILSRSSTLYAFVDNKNRT
jgi:hypothetical protein